MRWIEIVSLRLRSVFRRSVVDHELDAELASFVEQRTAQIVAAGRGLEEARREALRSLGNMPRVKEQCRDARRLGWLEDLGQDSRRACRSLAKRPGFTLVAVLTLGLGVGANTAIFSFLDTVLLEPLPYPDPDRIVRVLQTISTGDSFPITTEDFLDWQRHSTVFEFVAAQRPWTPSLTGDDEPTLLRGMRVSPSYYDVSRITPLLGRTFLPEEGQYGRDRVVILNYELWATRFGADPAIVGRTIALDGEPHQVVGVMPRGSVFDRTPFQIAKPLAFAPVEVTRSIHWLTAVARLKPGVTIEQAQAEMTALAAQLEREHPENSGKGVVVERFSDVLVGPQVRLSFYVLFVASGMVLLVGCTNLANLALARGVSRHKEVVVCAALGGRRGRLVRQLLTENLLVALLGGAVGVGLGYATLAWLRLEIPPDSLPAEAVVQLDGSVWIFALTISALTGLLFGLAPALHVTKPDLARAMKEGGRSSTSGPGSRRFRHTLVVAEVSLAFVLVTAAGLLVRSFLALQGVDLGFNPHQVLTARLPTPVSQYPDIARLHTYLRDIRRVVGAVPGVEDTALAAAVPLRGTSYQIPMMREGAEPVPRPRRPLYFFKIVTPSYFSVFGLPLRRGRLFDDRDLETSTRVVVINERMAARLFPNQDPLGQHILVPQILPGRPGLGDDVAYQVIGVVGNERTTALTDEATQGLYGALDQHGLYNPSLAVRAAVDPQSLQQSIRQAIDTINRDQVLSDVRTMDQIKAESVVGARFQTTLLTVFSGLALLLAAIGIYGVFSYSVAEQTHEIGLRAALGASPGRVMRNVLARGLVLAMMGLALGAVGSLVVTRLLATLLYGVGERDPVTLVSAAVCVVMVSLLACYVPARRATRIDPLVAFRQE